MDGNEETGVGLEDKIFGNDPLTDEEFEALDERLRLEYFKKDIEKIKESRANLELQYPAIVEMYRALESCLDPNLYGITVSVQPLDPIQQVTLRVIHLTPSQMGDPVTVRLYLDNEGKPASPDEIIHQYALNGANFFEQEDDESNTQVIVMNNFLGNDEKVEFLERFRKTEVGKPLFEKVEVLMTDPIPILAGHKKYADEYIPQMKEDPNVTVLRNLNRGPANPGDYII